MLRYKLRNQYLKCKSEEARVRFKIQRNLLVTLLRKAKRDYYENLELGKVSDSKKFWNTVKPVFGNEVTARNNITLIENEKVVTFEIELAKKGKSTEKTNYRSISILSNVSKIYERLMHNNMNEYFNDVLSKFQCGFRKGFGIIYERDYTKNS